MAAVGTTFTADQRADCARYLRQLFGELDAEQIDGILAIVGAQSLDTAETLFAQGDAPGAFYIVLSGRLRAIHARTEGEKIVLGDIAAGEPVGEIALFTKEPRMASVVAVRPTRLLRITENDYLQLIQRFPSLALSLNAFFIRRLRQNGARPRTQAAPRNVAVINLCERTDLAAWSRRALAEFTRLGTPAHVVHRPARPAEYDRALDFEAVESRGSLHLFVCDPVADAWTRACLTLADLVVVAFDFRSDPGLRQVEADLGLYADHLLGKRVYLLLMHPADTAHPAGTAHWLRPRRVGLHLHVREDHARDLRRFCRVLTNRAVGLVLSGGGAKGYAHLGAVRAMGEDGLEFDFIGGSSAGSMFAGALSRYDFDPTRLREMFGALARTAPTSWDYTIPLLSLMTGRKMRAALTHVFGDADLEDLWAPFYCTSANYSVATLAIHERGLARQRVEASVAIPGVFPPVLLDGQLHLDGGLFDNLPILAMLDRPVEHVAAVSLATQAVRRHDFNELPGAWQLLWDRLTGRRKFGLPSLPSLIANSLVLNSKHQLDASRGEADLFVRVDLQGFGLLDWRRWQDSYQQGYEQTRQQLAALPPEQKFWRAAG